jgi:hypothetical protein
VPDRQNNPPWILSHPPLHLAKRADRPEHAAKAARDARP